MRYKAIVFDIDGTLSEHISSWRLIHEKLGIWGAKAEKYQRLYNKGLISYKQFCAHDAALWKGLKKQEINGFFNSVRFFKNTKPALALLRKMGFKLIAVSSGLEFLPERMRSEGFNFDKIYHNELIAKNGVLTGKAKVVVSNENKGKILARALKKYSIKPRETICVCDSFGDMQMLEVCGYSIAFNSSDRRILKKADYACKTKNYNEILNIVLKISS